MAEKNYTIHYLDEDNEKCEKSFWCDEDKQNLNQAAFDYIADFHQGFDIEYVEEI